MVLKTSKTSQRSQRGQQTPDREQYNKTEFPETYEDAKFFIIKSYSEDDVHKSIKYNVWASTQNGNKKLDAAYREAQQKSEACPIFLFSRYIFLLPLNILYLVNTSGQFVGVAEMVGPVDFNKSLEYWQQDKWIGCFPVKWHIVKDLPNSLLKHIILEYNENKPVTNSRDTQEVKLAQGLQVIKVFKEHASKQCILDDFEFYEDRQKKIQQKKAKQQQFQKQSWEGKLVTDKKIKGAENEVLKSDDGSDAVKEVKLVNNVQDVAAKPEEVEVVVNGVANAC
ncbi:putative YTH domain-containing protein [Helianthus annuus]|nr:putative YTH domain-containing protein [Helianthus annuus]